MIGRTSTCFAAASLAVLALGCSKGSGNTASTATAAPAPPPAATQAATAAPAPAPAPAAATYRWETHKSTHMKFELPATWTISTQGDVLVAKGAGVGIEFVGASSALAAKNDEKAMVTEVGKILQNAKLTSKLKPVEQHGSKGFVVTGTGKKDGADVDWFSSAVGGKGGALLALGFYSPNIAPATKAQMVRVLDSIQPAG